jgi:Amt family ammonium transporter
MGQFWAELIGVTTCFITLSVLSLIVYFIAEKLVGNRVSLEVEIEGLDIPEMGVTGYSGFVMDKQSETPMLAEHASGASKPSSMATAK